MEPYQVIIIVAVVGVVVLALIAAIRIADDESTCSLPAYDPNSINKCTDKTGVPLRVNGLRTYPYCGDGDTAMDFSCAPEDDICGTDDPCDADGKVRTTCNWSTKKWNCGEPGTGGGSSSGIANHTGEMCELVGDGKYTKYPLLHDATSNVASDGGQYVVGYPQGELTDPRCVINSCGTDYTLIGASDSNGPGWCKPTASAGDECNPTGQGIPVNQDDVNEFGNTDPNALWLPEWVYPGSGDNKVCRYKGCKGSTMEASTTQDPRICVEPSSVCVPGDKPNDIHIKPGTVSCVNKKWTIGKCNTDESTRINYVPDNSKNKPVCTPDGCDNSDLETKNNIKGSDLDITLKNGVCTANPTDKTTIKYFLFGGFDNSPDVSGKMKESLDYVVDNKGAVNKPNGDQRYLVPKDTTGNYGSCGNKETAPWYYATSVNCQQSTNQARYKFNHPNAGSYNPEDTVGCMSCGETWCPANATITSECYGWVEGCSNTDKSIDNTIENQLNVCKDDPLNIRALSDTNLVFGSYDGTGTTCTLTGKGATDCYPAVYEPPLMIQTLHIWKHGDDPSKSWYPEFTATIRIHDPNGNTIWLNTKGYGDSFTKYNIPILPQCELYIYAKIRNGSTNHESRSTLTYEDIKKGFASSGNNCISYFVSGDAVAGGVLSHSFTCMDTVDETDRAATTDLQAIQLRQDNTNNRCLGIDGGFSGGASEVTSSNCVNYSTFADYTSNVGNSRHDLFVHDPKTKQYRFANSDYCIDMEDNKTSVGGKIQAYPCWVTSSKITGQKFKHNSANNLIYSASHVGPLDDEDTAIIWASGSDSTAQAKLEHPYCTSWYNNDTTVTLQPGCGEYGAGNAKIPSTRQWLKKPLTTT